ncbi:MAG: Gfo/Idh/MocA family oxidoreductase [Prolixibacteraceae bacterium]
MKSGRRNFLKMTGLAGLTFASGKLEAIAGEIKSRNIADLPQRSMQLQKSHVQHFNMSGFAAPKIETVRVGFIGLGNRGPAHVQTLSRIEGVEIKALCDIRTEKAVEVRKSLENSMHKPEVYAGGENEWKKLCERNDIDLVYVTTPWYMHADMAIYAMEHGKHVASEVPAAGSLEECWKLVETAERTRKHCMMMENYVYGINELVTLNMARQGFFGEMVHGDCAYIDNKMRNNYNTKGYWDMWWLKIYANRKGNIYPTHGVGHICQLMDVNRGDKLDYLVSLESNDFQMAAKSKELAEKNDLFKTFVGKDYRGNMNTTLIKTTKGRSIMLQHDGTSPRLHNCINGVYGTKGSSLQYPNPLRISKEDGAWVAQEECDLLVKKYTPEIFRKVGEITKNSGHGGGDLMEDWHLIDCLHNGLPLDQDVYDAAAWSSIIPLSEWSVNNRSGAIDIPDFTAGEWKKNKSNMDIELKNGGGNTRIV